MPRLVAPLPLLAKRCLRRRGSGGSCFQIEQFEERIAPAIVLVSPARNTRQGSGENNGEPIEAVAPAGHAPDWPERGNESPIAPTQRVRGGLLESTAQPIVRVRRAVAFHRPGGSPSAHGPARYAPCQPQHEKGRQCGPPLRDLALTHPRRWFMSLKLRRLGRTCPCPLARPTVERLEDRVTPAVLAFFNINTLVVIGDSADNNISVAAGADGTLQVTNNGSDVPIKVITGTANKANLTLTVVNADGGNDTITLDRSL